MSTASASPLPLLHLADGVPTAVIHVDIQHDFASLTGALYVPGGEQICTGVNVLTGLAREHGWHLYASRDWHPQKSKHFDKWPVHCVADSLGASFYSGFYHQPCTVISKGQDPNDDGGYSAFDGTGLYGQPLPRILRNLGVKRVIIDGLATDYCVRATALSARAAGYEVLVVTDNCAAVNLQPGDGYRALAELQAAGVQLATLAHIEAALAA